MTLTVQRLKQLLNYDSDSGIFTWKIKVCSRAMPGSIAGSTTNGRYIAIRIDKKRYWAHRLAFLYMTGSWPKFEVDHIDLNKLNNSFNNLRDVPHYINQWNKHSARSDSLTGLLGVSKIKSGYTAQIMANGNYQYLGKFNNAHEAHMAYMSAKHQRDTNQLTN